MTQDTKAEPKRRMTRRLLLALTLILALGTGVFIFLRQPDELEAYKTQLRADGEVLSLTDLLPPQSLEVLALNQQLETLAAGLVRSPRGNLSMMSTGASPGLAQAAWKQVTPPGLTGSNATWLSLAGDVDGEEAVLNAVRELLKRPPSGTAFDASDPLNSPSGMKLVLRRKTSQALVGAVLVNLQRGRLDAALTNLHGLLDLAQYYDPSGILVHRMIQVAVAGLALAATWEALQAPGWDADRLRALQAALQRLDSFDGYVRTVELERALARTYYAVARTNSDLSQVGIGLSILDSSNPVADFVNDSLYAPLWRTAWSKGDELIYLQTMQRMLEVARTTATNRSFRAAASLLDTLQQESSRRLSGLNRVRYQFVAQAIPSWRKATLALMRTETRRQLALCALAIRRYELASNQPPAALGQLVPAYLSEEPWDHMNGGKLRYQPLPGGQFLLYSAGENATDERGRGDDLSWPQEQDAAQ